MKKGYWIMKKYWSLLNNELNFEDIEKSEKKVNE